MFLTIRYCMSLKLEEQEMYMRLTPREKEMADMFEQMSKDEQEIMMSLQNDYERKTLKNW